MHRGELYRSIARAVVYSRVSTDAQERDGTSLDTQERACVEYAQAKCWTVVECVKDTASGSNLDRPGIERVRHLLSHGFVDVVLAYAVDRLSRNQIHIAVLLDDIEKGGAALEFVSESFSISSHFSAHMASTGNMLPAVTDLIPPGPVHPAFATAEEERDVCPGRFTPSDCRQAVRSGSPPARCCRTLPPSPQSFR